MTKVLLDRGADVLDRQSKGFAPIHEAAFIGRVDLVQLLLDRGAEINSRTDDGRTALTDAAAGGAAHRSASHSPCCRRTQPCEAIRARSRELHDALGHHLTALSLNIEAALHKTESPARDHLQTAQSLTRRLLGDVRDIAASIPNRGDVDLDHALQPLLSDVPRPQIHLEIEPGIRIDDPEQAHVIVRCTQEIVTNAVRHSSAENLWIVIKRDGQSVRIHARDDGRGAQEVGAGFEVVALLPRRSPA